MSPLQAGQVGIRPNSSPNAGHEQGLEKLNKFVFALQKNMAARPEVAEKMHPLRNATPILNRFQPIL